MTIKPIFLTLFAVAVATLCNLNTVNGQVTREWTNAAGGEFHLPFNWNGGVPFENDTALFDLAADFSVDLTGVADVDNLMIERGGVRFIGGNSLTATNANINGRLRIADTGTQLIVPGQLEFRTAGIDRESIIRDQATLRSGEAMVGGLGGNHHSVNVDDGGVWVTDSLSLGTLPILEDVGTVTVGDLGRINVGFEHTDVTGITVGSPDFLATMTVANGSSVGSDTTPMTIARFGGGEGRIIVRDQDSTLSASSILVGLGGTGSLTFLNDADLGGVPDIDIGGVDTSGNEGNGTVLIDNSAVTFGDTRVGNGGEGQLTVSNDATLFMLTRTLTVAAGADSIGTLEVNDSTLVANELVVGDEGSATAALLNASNVTVENLVVGSGSTMTVDDVSIFTLENGEVNGTLVVRDNARIRTNAVLTTPLVLSGAGLLNVNNNNAYFDDDVENLELEIRSGADTRFEANYTGIGLFTGTGPIFFSGDVDLGFGTAVSTFEGSLVLNETADFMVEIGGEQAGQFDRVEVGRNLEVAGALSASLANGFTFGPGQRFVIASVDGNTTGQFAGLPEGAVVGNPGGIEITITYTAVDGNDIALVTEGFLAGDVNCDGIANLLDVEPFVAAVSNGVFNSKADIDGNGSVDLLDVSPFVGVLAGN